MIKLRCGTRSGESVPLNAASCAVQRTDPSVVEQGSRARCVPAGPTARGGRRHPRRLPARFIKAEVTSFDDLVELDTMASPVLALVYGVREPGRDRSIQGWLSACWAEFTRLLASSGRPMLAASIHSAVVATAVQFECSSGAQDAVARHAPCERDRVDVVLGQPVLETGVGEDARVRLCEPVRRDRCSMSRRVGRRLLCIA